FELERWAAALDAHGVDVAAYLGTRPVTARLPWDHIDVGLEDGFLLGEYGKVAGMLIHHTNLADAEPDRRKLVCDAAVVAHQLAPIGLGVGEVGVVDQHAGDLAVLAEQEAVLEADVDVVPRQPRGHRAGAEVRGDVDAVRVERGRPALELEHLVPAVEPRPGAPHRLDHAGEPAIAAREHALDERDPAVVVLEPQPVVAATARIAGGVAQDRLLAPDLGLGV